MSDFSLDFQVVYDEERRSCTIRFRCFDTPNRVTLFSAEGDDAMLEVERLLVEARCRCLDFHRLWSFSAADSDVARINEPCGCIAVDPRTADLVSRMAAFNAIESSFDFTVGPVSYLWKHAQRVPSDAEIAAALSHVGAKGVHVDGSSVVKDDPLAQVDVGGAAKGYVADALVGFLRERGVACADIDLGGNLFLMGSHPEGRPWRVSVRVPDGMDVEPPVLNVRNGAIVTSGSYERFVEIGGKRYQHIIDASTGWPSESDIVSATVLSPSALEADLLATTACLLGSEGLAGLARRHPSCTFVAITSDGTVICPRA